LGVNRILKENKLLSAIMRLAINLFVFLRKIKSLARHHNNGTVVICFHKLGDSVFTIPALRALQDNIKQDFYIFCFDETKYIYEMYFKSDYIIGFSHSDILFNNRFVGSKIKKKLAHLNPERIFDFTGSVTSASLLITASAKEIIGINELYFKKLFTKHVNIRKQPHILDIYLDVIRVAFPGKDYDPYKVFPAEVNSDGYILIHPFAGWKAKEWEIEKFIEVAKRIAENYDVAFVAEDSLLNREVVTSLRERGIEVYETSTIKELIEVIKKSSVMFSNDSGPAFIANALGKPTFTIYGPTNPIFHIPYGNMHRYIQKKIECTPLIEKYCFTDAGRDGCLSFECKKQLNVDEVYDSLNSFIKELNINKRINVN
jgi:ADP-heptose:LPS heptosyltransferase